MARLLALALTVPLAVPVAAQEIRPDDQARMDQLDTATGRALRQVLAIGSDEDVVLATNALRGPAMPADPALAETLTGDWRCSMTKMGGNMAVVAYPPFRCRIEARDGVLHFDKLTGSQRTSGTIRPLDGRWIYLGSTFVQGEQPRRYDDFPAEIDTQSSETLPDVGVLEVTGEGQARLILPLPYRESILNVLVMTR
ncbi:DUF4893 domain-containing protein [Paracoccus sp. MC1862]|uniref:DUF4893 domain-containing protein n=1 Tax=Paracoccus sp. MC1862 TaxID=2760307 RepID=UPI0015FEF144|nr:DUF4893 domain-containing protein [Paracoccus sp. MC1862]MBB1497795.1 DUF4893 domain-containing protein [Paracoccus sp. MC1862]QQO45278.1 DUF4893 domain-containing protein [Paracoccus sp. MC1862]